MNPFSGAARLWRERRERKAMVADYYRNEAAPMSPERRKRLMEWRADDAISDAEIRAGKVRRFDNVQDALAWLNSDEEEGPVSHVHARAYSHRWDAFYCSGCGVWLEPECECGPECPFRGRPERMHHDHESED